MPVRSNWDIERDGSVAFVSSTAVAAIRRTTLAGFPLSSSEGPG